MEVHSCLRSRYLETSFLPARASPKGFAGHCFVQGAGLHVAVPRVARQGEAWRTRRDWLAIGLAPEAESVKRWICGQGILPNCLKPTGISQILLLSSKPIFWYRLLVVTLMYYIGTDIFFL